MTNSEEQASENTPHVLINEHERSVFVRKIHEIVAAMSLQELEKTLDVIEIIRE